MKFFMKFLKRKFYVMAQAGETLHDEINLQQVVSETKFVWLLNDGSS